MHNRLGCDNGFQDNVGGPLGYRWWFRDLVPATTELVIVDHSSGDWTRWMKVLITSSSCQTTTVWTGDVGHVKGAWHADLVQ